MEETLEGNSREQTVVSPELMQSMGLAKENIVSEAMEPQADILERTAKLGLFDALKEATKPHAKKMMEVQFKNLKVAGMAVLSLVPLLGEGASAARAAGKVAKFEGAIQNPNMINKMLIRNPAEKLKVAKAAYRTEVKTMKAGLKGAEKKAFEKVVAIRGMKGPNEHIAVQVAKMDKAKRGIFLRELRSSVHPETAFEHARKGIDTTVKKDLPFLSKVFKKDVSMPTGQWKYNARKGAEFAVTGKVFETLHALDPFPDVPVLVSMAGFLEMFGVHGAELIPAAWQFVANKVQMGKEQVGMSADVGKVLLSRMGVKFGNLKEGRVARAAETFLPTGVKAAV